MARKFFIVSYDVTDDRRRNRIFKTMNDFGDRVQYSVFCCQLNPRERLQMESRLKEDIHQIGDQVMVVEAGKVEGQNPEPDVDYIGKAWKPEPRIQIV